MDVLNYSNGENLNRLHHLNDYLNIQELKSKEQTLNLRLSSINNQSQLI